MLIERIWADNPGRNFHYLVACAETGEALAIDPLNAAACLTRARELGWSIRAIFNTHEHHDHTGGNAAMVAATGAPVIAHAAAAQLIPGISHAAHDGEVLRVGRSVELRCLDTPGHTRAHLCLFAAANGTEPPALFCGDTLFNAGVGNCLHGGDPELLYETFSRRLAALPAATRVFPGHEYLARNLAFTLDREPSNAAARALAQRCAGLPATATPILTLAEEREINVFLRLDSAELRARLQAEQASLPAQPSAREIFLALRELRNRW